MFAFLPKYWLEISAIYSYSKLYVKPYKHTIYNRRHGQYYTILVIYHGINRLVFDDVEVMF